MPPQRSRPSPSALASHGKSKGKFSTRPIPAGGGTGKKPARPMNSSSPSSSRPAPFPTKLSAAAGKRRRAIEDEEEEEEDAVGNEVGSSAEEDQVGDEEDGEVGTDEEVENAMERGRSSKTAKRKRRAVSPTSFGQALSAFLGDESDEGSSSLAAKASVSSPSTTKRGKAPLAQVQGSTQAQSQSQAPIFSLAPSISSRISSTKLSEKAARVALEERRSREDQFRVRDLIGGWGRPGEKPGQSSIAHAGAGAGAGVDSDAKEGGEMDEWLREGGSKGFERRLRKVAQRGVVKLFNAIRAAQSTTTDDVDERNKSLNAGAPALGASAAVVRPGNKNVLGGKSKELADLSKANFLDLIRSGGGGTAAAVGKTAKA